MPGIPRSKYITVQVYHGPSISRSKYITVQVYQITFDTHSHMVYTLKPRFKFEGFMFIIRIAWMRDGSIHIANISLVVNISFCFTIYFRNTVIKHKRIQVANLVTNIPRLMCCMLKKDTSHNNLQCITVLF